jgi:hypothetical protein
MNEKSKFEQIKNIKNEIDKLNNILKYIQKAEEGFTENFPNYFFAKNEQVIINEKINSLNEAKISLMKNEIKDIAAMVKKEDILDIEEVSKVIEKNWKKPKINKVEYNLENNKDVFEKAVNYFNNFYGVKFKVRFDKSELKIVEYSIIKSKKSELVSITVYVAPGVAYAKFDNTGFDWSTKVLTNDKLIKEIKSSIKDNTN